MPVQNMTTRVMHVCLFCPNSQDYANEDDFRSRAACGGARPHRRSERRGRACLPDDLSRAARRPRPMQPMRAPRPAFRSGRSTARSSRIKDLFDVAGEVTRAGSQGAGRRGKAGHGRRAGGAAAARGRRGDRRQDQHERIRLLRRRRQSAFRHARQSGRPHARARRLVVGRGGRGGRRHVRDRDRHRHRRLDAAFPARSAASSASSRASSAFRPTARFRCPSRSTRSGRWRAAVADCAKADAVMAGEELCAARAGAARGPAPRHRARHAAENLDETVAQAFPRRDRPPETGRRPHVARKRCRCSTTWCRSTAKAACSRPKPSPSIASFCRGAPTTIDPNVRARIERAAQYQRRRLHRHGAATRAADPGHGCAAGRSRRAGHADHADRRADHRRRWRRRMNSPARTRCCCAIRSS